MTHRIMVVEDDPIIAEAIEHSLKSWNYDVFLSRDFRKVHEDFFAFQPHLILLDIKLPFYNGYHWCQEIRKFSLVPIIFISSAAEDMNIVMAVNMGADDYLIKPFDLSVLEAKVKALLRRTYDFGTGTEMLEHRGVVLHLSEMRVSFRDEAVTLTKNEFRILEFLFKKKGFVVSREDLMDYLWQSDEYVDDNTLTVNVTRLRKTLESIGIRDLIMTKKGVGYYVAMES